MIISNFTIIFVIAFYFFVDITVNILYIYDIDS